MISGIILKNMLHAKDPNLQKSCEARWCSTEAIYKQRFKELLLFTVKNGPSKLSGISGCILGQIARIEIPRGEDTDFFTSMRAFIDQPGMAIGVLEATGICCSYLIEETQVVLTPFSEDIFRISLSKIDVGDKELTVGSLKCLMNSLEALEVLMKNDANIITLLEKIMEICSVDDDFTVKALICLNRFVALYYPMLKEHIPAICGFVFPQFKSLSNSVVIQVFEFSSILVKAGDTKTLEESLPIILKSSLDKLYKPDDYIDEEWSPHKAASTTLELLSEIFGSKIITDQTVSKFIEANMNAEDPKKKEAGIIALGSTMLPGYDLCLEDVIPMLIFSINDPIIRDSTLWTLAKICETNFVSVIEYLPMLLSATGKVILENNKFSVNAAWVQSCIFTAYSVFPEKVSKNFSLQNGHPSETLEKLQRIITVQYIDILNQLVKASENVQYHDFNLRTAIFSALTELVSICPESQKNVLDVFMNYLLNRADECLQIVDKVNADQIFIIEDILANYVILLQVITSTISSPITEQVIEIYCMILSSKPTRVYGDVYISLSHITNKILPYVNTIMPFLARDLACSDSFILKSAVNLTGDLANALEASFIPLSTTIIPLLIQNISSPAVSRDLKPIILSVFGDCALALGKSFQPYIEMTLTILGQIISLDRSLDEEYVDELRKSSLLMFSCVLIALGDNQNLKIHMGEVVNLIKQLVDNQGAYRCPKEVVDILGDLVTVYGLSFGLDGDWVREFLYECMQGKDSDLRMNADRVCDLLNN